MSLPIDIIATAQAMNARGIGAEATGNVSARTKTGMLVTPEGMDYSSLTPDDIVAMDFDTSWFATNNLRPSSEWRLHLEILANRPEVNAVVHTHSTYGAALSTHRRGIGPFHYMVAVAGGNDIRCAAYATIGSQELSDNVLTALEDRSGCLVANHGVVATGVDLGAALTLAGQIEELARQYLAALTLGEPQQLTHSQMEQVIARMANRRDRSNNAGYVDDDDQPGAKVLHLDR